MYNFTALEQLEIQLKDNFKQTALYSFGASAGIFLIFIALSGSTSTDKFLDNAFPFFILSFFIFIALFALGQSFISNRTRNKAFKQFALDNNFTFTDSPSSELRHGHFLSYGNSQKYSFCIESLQSQFPFSFFNFEYGIEYKNSKGGTRTDWYPFTIFSIQLPKATPNIYIHNKNNNTINEPFTEDQRLSLNVDLEFEKNHSVYAPKQYEIEALQILDATFVQLLSQTVSAYDVELFGAKLFIYIPQGEVTNLNTNEVKKLFELYARLNQPLTQKMNTFSFAQIGDASTLLKKDGLNFFESHENAFGFLVSRNGIGAIIIIIALIVAAFQKFILPLING